MDSQNQKKIRLKISIRSVPELVEPISDFLLGLTDAGIEISLNENDTLQTLHAYLAEADIDKHERERMCGQIMSFLSELAAIFMVDIPSLSISGYVEEDWGSTWKKHFTPFAIVPGLVIAPTWEKYQPAGGELVIEMDPGMAFGTGHHATTSMSLSLVRDMVESGAGSRVLDAGTGTGILGMAAVLFGAKEVLAIDNDPLAVTAARENVERNGLSGVMRVSGTALENVEGDFSLIVANIIHETLMQLAGQLDRLLAIDGALVLSGILQGEQTSSIIRCFEGFGYQVQRIENMGEWTALLLMKRKTVS
jgi:ribosomal protein L11 methyltransferase